MKIDSKKMKDLLSERLQGEGISLSYDAKKEVLRAEDANTNKGITLSLAPLTAKAEISLERTIDEAVYYVTEGLKAMKKESSGLREEDVYPVIRSTSFPSETKEGQAFVMDEHTAETRIYYAVDSGRTFRLLDEKTLEESGWTKPYLRETALRNLEGLKIDPSKDEVAGNIFYFVSSKDGYDASKILNKTWLRKMKEKVTGEMAVAVPHGDVCIVADIRNNTGYDILAQMCMSFFAGGHAPITALSFLYENEELEPIFILGKNKENK